MKRMIDAEKFLDKLLYMGYMDEQKSEVEEVANRMTEEAYTKEEVVAMLTEIQLEIEDLDPNYECNTYYAAIRDCSNLTQQKIDKLKEVSE